MGIESDKYITVPQQIFDLEDENPQNIEDFFDIFKKYRKYNYGNLKGLQWNSENIAEFATFLYFFSKFDNLSEFAPETGRPTTATYKKHFEDFKRVAKKFSVTFRKKRK